MTEHAILTFARYRRFLVTHPDGTSERLNWDGQLATSVGGGRTPEEFHYAERASVLKHPEWNQAERGRWCYETTVTEERGWEAGWCDVSGQHRLDVTVDSWYWGVPAQSIVQKLDEYGQQSWAIAHVSEDRGVYLGADVPDESFITRIRYLLVRDGSRPPMPSQRDPVSGTGH